MSYQLDFFGKPQRRPGPRAAPSYTGDLFEGAAWTWAAEQWARDNGLKFEGWTIARRFRAGGRWYAVEWDGEPQAWDIRPAAEG